MIKQKLELLIYYLNYIKKNFTYINKIESCIFNGKNGKINNKEEQTIQGIIVFLSFFIFINGKNKNSTRKTQITFLSVNIKAYIDII